MTSTRRLISDSWLIVIIALALVGCSADSESPDDVAITPGFIGSDQCAACHASEFEHWRGSHHQLAMQVANESTVLGDFDNVTVPYFETAARFFMRDGQYLVEAQDHDGDSREFRITHAFGIEPLQQYLVDTGNGRKQVLQFAWDSRGADKGGKRWYHLYPDEYIGPGDTLHWTGRYFNWNYMCAECHSTDVRLDYDIETDSFNTTFSEISVGCEACHGPGSRHVAQAHSGSFDARWGLALEFVDRRDAAWTMNAETGTAQRSIPNVARIEPEACGRCHSRRSVIARDYEYGRPLTDTHLISLLEEHLYHADGRIQDEVYVYGSFVQSKMYAAGVTCSDCHDPHSGQLRSGPDPNAVCATCHLPDRFASEQHSQVSIGQCVDCHMPATTYMGVDDRRDHSFRIPGAGESEDHYGRYIASGREGNAGDGLLKGIANSSYPPIARGTMLSLLGPIDTGRAADLLADQANDPDPLVRIGLLRALRQQAPKAIVRTGTQLLRDPVRAVRIEAALTFVDYRDLLPLEDARAFSDAAREYREAMLGAAFMPDAAINLAEFERRLGNDAESATLFEHGLRTGENIAQVQHAYGLFKARSADHEAALLHLRRATELDPDAPWFAYVYGVALNSTGSADEAIEVLSKARDRFPGHFDIAWALVTMHRDAGNRDKARSLLAELQEQFPDNPRLMALDESL